MTLQRIVKKIGLVLLGLAVGLFITEIGLRMLPGDTFNNIVFSTARGRQLYTTDHDIGWVLRPNLDTKAQNRDLMEFQLTTNNQGLREQGDTAYEKPEGVYRVLILGDSFAEGIQVELADIFPTTLEPCLAHHSTTAVEVINGGVSGYSLGDEYMYYLGRGANYKPDLVVATVFLGNEFEDLDRQSNYIFFRIAGGYRFDLVNSQIEKQWYSWDDPADSVVWWQRLLRRYSLVYKFLFHPDSKLQVYLDEEVFTEADNNNVRGVKPALPDWPAFIHATDFARNPMTPPQLIGRWELFKALVQELHQKVSADGADLVFVLIPKKEQAQHHSFEKYVIESAANYTALYTVAWDFPFEPNRTIVNFLNDTGIRVLDLLPAFQEHYQTGSYDLYYQHDRHFNREGHYLTRDVICNWLVEQKLVP